MKKCIICMADVADVADVAVADVCKACNEFLTHVAPLSFESHMAHYARKQAGDMARFIEYLTNNSYEKEDDSYFEYDSVFYFNK